MTFRIAVEPAGTLGVFDDSTAAWAAQGLADEEAAAMLAAAEPVSGHEARTLIRQMRGRKAPKRYIGYYMTWEEAEWLAAQAAGTPAGSRPLEFDAKGQRIRKHGLGGYLRGCRCGTCRRQEDDGSVTHGFGPTGKPSGYAQGCRCRTCTDAKAEYARELRARKAGRAPGGPAVTSLSADEVRDASIGVRFTAEEKALIERLAAQDGKPAGQWIREPGLEIAADRAGYQDPVSLRHWQVRREGVSGTGEDTGDGSEARKAIVGVRFTRPEKALIEQLAAEDRMPAGQWLREPVLAILEDRAGYADTARRKMPRQPNRGGQAAGD